MEMKEKERLTGLIESGEILIPHHARVRMFERNVSTDDLIATILSGEIIEMYPDDEPCHPYLSWDRSKRSCIIRLSRFANQDSWSLQDQGFSGKRDPSPGL
jgi:hypothetical protein